MNVAVPSFGGDYLSLCSGGGGLDRGVRLVHPESRAVCYVENEVTAAGVLVANMEAHSLDAAPVWSDLKTLDARAWRGLVDGVIGGYPCQPFSNAGKRLGADDPRHLWPHVAGIVAAVEPRWCFFENVGAHLRLGFHEVARSLQGMGYTVAGVLLTAEEVGAPHGRERLFILAHREGGDGRCGVGAAEAGVGADGERWRGSSSGGGELDEPSGGGRLLNRGVEVEPHRDGPHDRVPVEAGRSGDTCWGLANPSDVPRDVPPTGGADGTSRGVAASAGRDGHSLGVALGDTDLARLEGRGESLTGSRYELPAWPPGPTDDAGWRRVIAVRPDLAPATQPALRGVADELARRDGDALSRADQLHVLGNGVVPAQAAYALRMLEEAMGAQGE